MEATGKALNYSWIWTLCVLIYFFNTLPPDGITLTLLLTPVWLYLLYRWKISFQSWLTPIVLTFAVYSVIHVANGVIAVYYVISTLMIAAAAILAIFVYHALQRYTDTLDLVFRQLLMLNFVFTIIALVVLFIPQLKDSVWYTMSISEDIKPFPRLKLFTSEASHYSFLFAPLAVYFISRLLFFPVSKPYLTLLFVCLPLVLSFSLGVLLCLLITWIIVMIIFFKRICYNQQRRHALVFTILACIGLAVVLYLIYPENPLYHRLGNILHNKDTSARGRTLESFMLADKIAGLKSHWFGVGPGQLKVLGRNIIIQYYRYVDMPPVVRIPNACAETIACFGYSGLIIRLATQVFLFFKTRVADNPFRLWLFLFLFLYQFTGSFITNPAEYIVWALVFAPVFPDFIPKTHGGDRL